MPSVLPILADPSGDPVGCQGGVVRARAIRNLLGPWCLLGGRRVRRITSEGAAFLEQEAAPRCVLSARGSGHLPGHAWVGEPLPDGGRWMASDDVPFASYPEEWTWRMLMDAASLLLEFGIEADREGLELQIGAPKELVFQWTRPRFRSPLACLPPAPGTSVWPPLEDFLKGFLLPLALTSCYGLKPVRYFLADPAGMSHEETRRILGFWGSLKSPFMRWLALPDVLEPLAVALEKEGNAPRFRQDLFRALARDIHGLPLPQWEADLADLEELRAHPQEALRRKVEAIRTALEGLPEDGMVLDLGAGRGEFTLVAAQTGHPVVALDRDPGCLDALYQVARTDGLPVLPLVMDLERPTPAQGWDGAEQASFQERAAGRFDLVLAFGLMHHLRYSGDLPLAEQMARMAAMTRRRVLLEWVPTEDAVVQRLMRRRYLPEDYTPEGLQAAWEPFFRCVSTTPTGFGGRQLHLLEKRD